jgi:hypothetical protein
MELNPNHPATQAAHDQWHKIAALLVVKLGGNVTIEDIKALGRSRHHAHQERLHRSLVRLDGRGRADRNAGEQHAALTFEKSGIKGGAIAFLKGSW